MLKKVIGLMKTNETTILFLSMKVQFTFGKPLTGK